MGKKFADINDGLSVAERNKVMDYVYPFVHSVYKNRTVNKEDPALMAFFKMMRSPEQIALKFRIPFQNKSKLTAVRELYMAAIRTHYGANIPSPDTDNPELYRQNILEEYNQEVTHIVLLDDPVYQISPNQSSFTELEFLFSQTHFQSVQNQTRAETKTHIKNEITRLYTDPLTHHVIATLSHLMKNKLTSRLVFSGSSAGVSLDGFAYYNQRDDLIFCPPLHNLSASKSARDRETGLGNPLIHESLHFIFYTLYKNNALPFEINSTDKKLQLQTAVRDTSMRMKRFVPKTLNEFQVLEIMDEVNYYKQQDNADIRLIEMIVRPIECLTAGYALDAVKKIAPTVWSFYQKTCLPDIEKYLAEQRGKSQPPQLMFKLPNDPKDHSAAWEDRHQFEQLFISMQSLSLDCYTQAAITIDDFLHRHKDDSKYKKIRQAWDKLPKYSPNLPSEFEEASLCAMIYICHTLLQESTLPDTKAKAKRVTCDNVIILLCAIADVSPKERLEHSKLLTDALQCGAAVLLEPKDKNVSNVSHKKYNENLENLGRLATRLPGHASNSLLVVSLVLMFIGVAILLAFALIQNVPAFAASFVTALHQTGLYNAAATLGGALGATEGACIAGAGAGIAIAGTGLGLFTTNKPQGLAKNMDTLAHMNRR